MKRSASGGRWLSRHVSDPYVRQARASGWRSRAAFKLIEIDRRDRILRPGAFVVDLGAAPGSWSQVAVVRAGAGRVIGIDLLPIEPLSGARFLRGDLRNPADLAGLAALVPAGGADLVLSDMAPNLCGVAASDQARSAELVELALEFASRGLRRGGDLLVKVFQGSEFARLRALLAGAFERVLVRKPGASRGESAECYLLCRGRR
ncbi:MAG: 23S rRNA (uridine(2552)-2'-O)-methyltransferase RlmE [Rhodocyclaceae bacterium]